MAHNTVWGLDIGNSAVKALKVARSGSDAVIVDFDIIDIYGGEEGADRAVRVQAALQTLCTNHDLARIPVYLSLPGELSLFKEFQLPPGSENKLNELVMYEAKQQIPMLDQVELGWERYDDPTGTGLGVELIAIRKAVIQETLQLTDQFKLNVQGITVSPVALFNFIQFEHHPQGPTLILDAGYKGTDFVVMHGRHIYSRTIPIAGREITRALENKFKVPFEKAEDLKKNIGQSKQAEKILGVIEPTLRQLNAEIQRTVGFWKSRARGQKIAQGFLLGHTFRLPKMAETLAGQLSEAPFTVVEGVQKIMLDRAINPGVFSNEFPTMAVAIGLGVQGLGLSELTVNLLPRERKTEIAVGRKKLWGVLSAAALLAALGVSYAQAGRRNEKFKNLKQDIDQTLKDVEKYEKQLKTAVSGVRGKSEPLARAQKRLQRLTRATRDRGRLLQVFNYVATLKDDKGQPFFGEARRTYLTNVYLSRTPFSVKSGALPAVNPAYSNHRRQTLAESKNLAGGNSYYAPLKKNPGVLKLPPELRPDVPLVAIVSGECEGADAFAVLRDLKAALERSPEVSDVRTDEYRVGLKRHEPRPNLDWDGRLRSEKPTEGEPRKISYATFHVMFRWKPKDDPDIEPKAPAPRSKGRAKKGVSRKKKHG